MMMKRLSVLAVVLTAISHRSGLVVNAFTSGSRVQHAHPLIGTKSGSPMRSPSAWFSPNPKIETRTIPVLRSSESLEDLEEVRDKDPIGYVVKAMRATDINAMINTGLIVLVAIAVLSKFATVDSGMMRGWTAAEMAARIPMDNWESYSDVLEAAPVSTKAVTSATVYTIGDVIAQRTEGKTMGEIDRPRVLRSLLAGLVGHGPLSHVWYGVSEGLFNDVLHWTAWWAFLPKVVVDQTVWSPIWNNMYIILLGVMKFESPKVIWKDIKRTTIPLIVSGLKLWPLAHCITYGLIPVENRLLWVDLIEIIWVTILATQAAGGSTKSDDSVPEPEPVIAFQEAVNEDTTK